jgi:hypothetical protein
MWEIRENTGKYDSDYRMGMKKESKLQEAYDCGFEDGYEKAMEELEDKKKGEHSSYRDDESGYRRRR